MRSVCKGHLRLFFLLLIVVIVLPLSSGFTQDVSPQVPEAEERELRPAEPIEKSEEAREQEKIRKFEQTQYELDEMGMTLEERKMRRVRPERP